MGILVAGGAGIGLEVKDSRCVVARNARGISNFVLDSGGSGQQSSGGKCRCRLVAVSAQNGEMASGEREAGLLVLSKRKG